MKKCTICKNILDLINFSKDKSRKDGLSCKCKNCQRKLSKRHYINNKDDYGNRQKARKLTHSEYINEIKEKSGCVICGENRGICLEFHHTDPKEKEFAIASRLHSNLDVLLEEISKCVVLCANCHRVVHSQDINLSC